MKETDLKAFIYTDMIGGEDVKELETRLTHWESVSKEYTLEINPEKTLMLKLEKWRKNRVVKINGKEIKVVDKFVHLGSLVEKSGKSKTR
jgi:hypothetical protein